jgi:hypothetical protein
MSEPLLENRDYTVIIGRTTTRMALPPPGIEQQWLSARTAILTLLQKCHEFDPDGMTVYMSSKEAPDFFRQYRHVIPNQLEQIFEDNFPPTSLNLLHVLRSALDDYFIRKAAGQSKPNGEMILVLIDGEPTERMAIAKAIVQATQRMDEDLELGIGFVQIGEDLIARGFLEALDENLRLAAGAKFDIVHTRAVTEIQPTCLTEFLLDILHD